MTPGQIAEGQRLARQWTSAKKSSAPPFEARANSSQPSTSEKASPAPPSPDLSEIKQLIEAQNNEIHSLKARNETSSSKSSAPVYHTSVDSPSFHESENRRLFAVVVGVEHYPGGIHDAPFADRDAQAVYRHLRALGVPPDHIRKLTDDIATQGRIRGAVRWLARNAKPDSTLWIYFSGHGAPTSKGVAYLVPFGGDPSDLEDTAYSLSALYNQLNKIHAHRIIVALDSCFSGEGKRSVLAHGAKPLVLHIKTGSVPSSGKLIVLSGAKGDQEAGVLEKKGHGIFTYYLLKGLDGGAVRGGHVTVASLYEYLKTRVTDAANLNDGNQTPVLQPVLSKDGNIRLR